MDRSDMKYFDFFFKLICIRLQVTLFIYRSDETGRSEVESRGDPENEDTVSVSGSVSGMIFLFFIGINFDFNYKQLIFR